MSLPQRRNRSVSPKPGVQYGGGPSSAPSSQQQYPANSNTTTSARSVTPPVVVPVVEVTNEACDLIQRMRDSSAVYRGVIQAVERAVTLGVMRGDDERHIVLECQRIMLQNPINERSDLVKLSS